MENKMVNVFGYVLENLGCESVVNDACNIYSESYEEYMTLYHLLTDFVKNL